MSISHIDLEQGSMMITLRYQNCESDDDEDMRSICFSDADEDSCLSTFYSNAGGSHEDFRFTDHAMGDVSDSDCSVEVEIHGEEDEFVKMHSDDEEEEVGDELRECRICHLSLGSGIGVIELGCECKNDLAVAHTNCAERWFRIRGNRICEICNSAAENVNAVIELDLMQQSIATGVFTIVTPPIAPPSPVETSRSFLLGHCFLNFLLACITFAFIIYWLFHFNMPS